MYDIIFLLTVALVCFLYIRFTQKIKRTDRIKITISDKVADVPDGDELIIIEWREFRLPMKYIEYLEIWSNMPDWHRKKLARLTDTEVKAGKHKEYAQALENADTRVIKDTSKAAVQIHP